MPELPNPKAREHPSKTPPNQRPTIARPVRPPGSPEYAELQVTTNYSFLRGASHPEEFAYQAANLGLRAIAITDHHTLAGVVRAHVGAKEVGIPLVVGARVDVGWEEPSGKVAKWRSDKVSEPHHSATLPLRHSATPPPILSLCHPATSDPVSLLLYPTDRPSYGRLCRLLTAGKRRAPKGECHLRLSDIVEFHEGLLAIALPPPLPDSTFTTRLRRLKDIFNDDRLSLGASFLYGPDDDDRLASIAALAERTSVPMVALNDAHYHTPDRRALQDVLTCVRHGCTIHTAGTKLFANADRHLKSPDEMARLFHAYPRAIRRTIEIADRCLGEVAKWQSGKVAKCAEPDSGFSHSATLPLGHSATPGFTLDQLRYEYPDEVVSPGSTPQKHLADLTWQGALIRYPNGIPDKVRKLIDHELELIADLKYEPYFLTVHDIVVYARSQGILCQGRGAAANSAVCYMLGVTSVDPDRIDLLFERFISRERNEPPDIDIDFEHERREEVIQYIYKKYGRDRAALTAEVISYRGRSAVRDVGKALGLSLDAVDRLAKQLDWWHFGAMTPDQVRGAGFDPGDRTLEAVVTLTRQLIGFPRHLSQHVGGFVITRGLLSESVPIENAAMDDRTVIEWDKDDIDALGMLKVDVLGLGMLTAISKCFKVLNGDGPGSLKGLSPPPGKPAEAGCGESEAIAGGSCDPVPTAEAVGYKRARPVNGPEDQHSEDHGQRSDARVQASQHRNTITDPLPPRPLQRPCPLLDRGFSPGCESDTSLSPPVDSPSVRFSGLPALPASAAPPPRFKLELHNVPPEDQTVYDMICNADTIGVFQIESRAQMSMLPRLKPRCFYDLVIEVAIVRPGPIQGKMVHPYLRRRNGEEPINYPNDDVQRVLHKTLGVPLFQEQAMSLAIVAAGFTPGEADQLRRAMAAWKRKGDLIYRFGEKLVAGMLKRGYPAEFAERCFEQIKGFSEYGFPESHAASFALLVYVSAWLKCHHPAAFCAAVINSQPMGFYAPAQLVRDAKEHGVEVRPVDVNHSKWDCTLEESGEVAEWQSGKVKDPDTGSAHSATLPLGHSATSPALRLGLRLVDGLSQPDADSISSAVAIHGRFASIDRLMRASGVSVAALRRLAAADAFNSMGLTRQQALWQIRRLRDEYLPLFDPPPSREVAKWQSGQVAECADPNTLPLCHSATSPLSSDPDDPVPSLPPIPLARTLRHDYESIGLSLKAHPLSLERDALNKLNISTALALRDEQHFPHGTDAAVAGLVLVRQRPGTAAGIVFITIEDETGAANLILFPKVYERFRKAARHSVAIVAWGRIERQGQVVHLKVHRIADLRETTRFNTVTHPVSRDFH